MDVSRMHAVLQQIALRVDEQMALAAVDLFSAVVSTRSAHLGGLDRLAVNDRGCRLRRPADLTAITLAQSLGHVLPRAILAPLRIVVPLFPSWSAVVDPDHRRFFVADENESTFDYFCGSTDHCWMEDFAVPYTRARFQKVDQDVTARSPSPQDWWTPADARELRVTLRAVK